MRFAMSSLPVPLSPTTRMVASESATFSTSFSTFVICSLWPMISFASSVRLSCRFRYTFSDWTRRIAIAFLITSRISSFFALFSRYW